MSFRADSMKSLKCTTESRYWMPAINLFQIGRDPSTCPEGMPDNSPRFQPWEPADSTTLVPKGRLKSYRHSVVPSGRMGVFNRSPCVETLGYYQASLRDEDTIFVVKRRTPVGHTEASLSRK